ncbi:hypothetical protein ES702_02957 [subsurface metagenome]
MEVLQDRRELSFSLQIILQNIPILKKVIEIGIYKGGTLRLWQTISAPDSILIGVDVHDFTGGRFSNAKNVSLIFGRSDAPGVITKVKSIVGDNVDLLFIDGDHSYQVVKSDYDNYGSLVRPGGLIIFHDTQRSAGSSPLAPKGCYVKKFWRELIDMNVVKEYYEFCFNANLPQQMGTGIIVK